MLHIHEGQCGVCAHYGEEHPNNVQLVQIHNQQEAPEDFTDDCGHPRHANLHLKVTAVSSCDGFEPLHNGQHQSN